MSDKCEWHQDKYDTWNTECGNEFEFMNYGGPGKNGYKFCQHCGGMLVAVPYQDEEEE